ncbi:MAG: ATP-binding protein, partial [Treponema sp.]|nr:ATP-binding protein [Treponema sp.]
SSYADRCEKLHICYDVKLALPETPIPNYEMCIILGNLLENAVEAAQPVGAAHPVGAARQSKTDSRIELVVQTQGTHLAIMVKNNYSGELTLADGKPVSAKKDSGFGLRSVRAVAARYDGEVITEWDKETFKTYVMLSMNN